MAESRFWQLRDAWDRSDITSRYSDRGFRFTCQLQLSPIFCRFDDVSTFPLVKNGELTISAAGDVLDRKWCHHLIPRISLFGWLLEFFICPSLLRNKATVSVSVQTAPRTVSERDIPPQNFPSMKLPTGSSFGQSASFELCNCACELFQWSGLWDHIPKLM